MKKLESILRPVTTVMAVLVVCYMTLSIWMRMHLSALIPPMIYLILPLAVCMSLLLLCGLGERKGAAAALTALAAAALLMIMAVHGVISILIARVEYPTGSPAAFGMETAAMYVLPLAAVGMADAWLKMGTATAREERWVCVFDLTLLAVMAVHIVVFGLFYALGGNFRGMDFLRMILTRGDVARYYAPVWGIVHVVFWIIGKFQKKRN